MVYVVSVCNNGYNHVAAVCKSKEKAEQIVTAYKEFHYSEVNIEEFDADTPIENYYNIYRFSIKAMEFICNPIYEYIEGTDKPIGELFGYGKFKNVYVSALTTGDAIAKAEELLSEYLAQMAFDKESCHYVDEYNYSNSCYYVKKDEGWVKQ